MTNTTPSVYFQLTASAVRSAYSVLVSCSYPVTMSVFYPDSDETDPFIVAGNTISFLPASSLRTTYIKVTKKVTKPNSYSFGISASLIEQCDGDYLHYDLSAKTLDLCSYTVAASDLNLAPAGTMAIQNSDLGTEDTYGLQAVYTQSSPADSVARMTMTQTFSSQVHAYSATACRIRPKVFATNAHNIFNSEQFSFIKGSALEVGRMGNDYVEYLTVGSWYLSLDYYFDAYNGFSKDFALLLTTVDLATNSLGISATESLSLNDSVYTFGYPSPTEYGLVAQYDAGTISSINANGREVETTMHSSVLGNVTHIYGGSSGSPVIKNGKFVGLHNGAITHPSTGSVSEHFVRFTNDLQSLVSTVLMSIV